MSIQYSACWIGAALLVYATMLQNDRLDAKRSLLFMVSVFVVLSFLVLDLVANVADIAQLFGRLAMFSLLLRFR